MAPGDKRGRHSGVVQVLWYRGPAVVLLMFLVLAPPALIVFAHLALTLPLAIVHVVLMSAGQDFGRNASSSGGVRR